MKLEKIKLEKLIKIKLWWIQFEKKTNKKMKKIIIKKRKKEKGPYAWFG
jgi:hypothetical protein